MCTGLQYAAILDLTIYQLTEMQGHGANILRLLLRSGFVACYWSVSTVMWVFYIFIKPQHTSDTG